MATFISLVNYTHQGIANIKGAPERLEATKTMLAELGGELKHFFLTMGAHDVVLIYELPGDEAAVKYALELPAGTARRLKLAIGQKIELPRAVRRISAESGR